MARALRGVLIVLLLAGYTAALGSTASGEGLKLIPHLAFDHTPTAPPLPRLVGESEGDRDVLPTLRPEAHTHDGHAHPHDGHRHRAQPVSRMIFVRVVPPAGRGLHEHDGAVHSHERVPDEQALLVTVSLDKHRLPATPAVPAPRVLAVRLDGEGPARLGSVEPSVETPPPIGRG